MNAHELAAALAAPFPSDRVAWKPQAVSRDKKRALAVAYIDARDVAQRLDDVVGPLNWQVDHKQIGDQIVTGLGIWDAEAGAFVWKWDAGFVGGADSESPDDQVKARKGTISDGLKRAAVLWGIGRYLYRLPKVWIDFDAERKKLASTPPLPQWALPESERRPASEKAKRATQRLSRPDGDRSHSVEAGNGHDNQALEQARQAVCPVAPMEHPEFKGKTLGELMTLSPKFVEWMATFMAPNGDPARQAARRAALILTSVASIKPDQP